MFDEAFGGYTLGNVLQFAVFDRTADSAAIRLDTVKMANISRTGRLLIAVPCIR